MELTKHKKIGFVELYKYTKDQLFIKDKIQLGIVLDKYDYLELYYDLLDRFKNLAGDNETVQIIYINYLNIKYDCTFKFSTIKNMILARSN